MSNHRQIAGLLLVLAGLFGLIALRSSTTLPYWPLVIGTNFVWFVGFTVGFKTRGFGVWLVFLGVEMWAGWQNLLTLHTLILVVGPVCLGLYLIFRGVRIPRNQGLGDDL